MITKRITVGLSEELSKDKCCNKKKQKRMKCLENKVSQMPPHTRITLLATKRNTRTTLTKTIITKKNGASI